LAIALPDLSALDESARSCLARYVGRLIASLGEELEEVVLFGLVARAESWPQGMPIRSDIDLLVVTRASVDVAVTTQLLEATYELFLECGRQIAPCFRARKEMQNPADDRAAAFLLNVSLCRRGSIRRQECRNHPNSDAPFIAMALAELGLAYRRHGACQGGYGRAA
jgi:predicted nucleotidyltransferase